MTKRLFVLPLLILAACPKPAPEPGPQPPPQPQAITANLVDVQLCESQGGIVVSDTNGCRAKISKALPYTCTDTTDILGCSGPDAITVDVCVCQNADECWDGDKCKSTLPPSQQCSDFSAQGKETDCKKFGACLFATYKDPDDKFECITRESPCTKYNAMGWSAAKLTAVCQEEQKENRCELQGDGSCANPPKQPPQRPKAPLLPNDPKFASDQWNLQENTPANPGGINMPWAWAVTTGLDELVIGLGDWKIKTHLNADLGKVGTVCHPRYFPVQKSGSSAGEGHGTQVLGISAGCTNNGIGLAGIDWKAKVLGVEYISDKGVSTDQLNNSMGALADIQLPEGTPGVLNFSLGSTENNVVYSNVASRKAIKETLDAIRRANDNKKVFVIASGNSAVPTSRAPPGVYPGQIVVGATNRQGVSAQFSNWESPTISEVSIMAPGQDIPVVTGGTADGTSFSAPTTTGVVSLMKAAFPKDQWDRFNYKVVDHILKATAKPMSCAQYCSDEYDKSTKNPGAKAQCRNDCCLAGDPDLTKQNICTAGLLNAYEAVFTAQFGVPDVPLSDASRYYVELKSTGSSGKFDVINVGGSDGQFEIDGDLTVMDVQPNKFSLDPGAKQTVTVTQKAGVFANIFRMLLIKTLPYNANDPKSDSLKIVVWLAP